MPYEIVRYREDTIQMDAMRGILGEEIIEVHKPQITCNGGLVAIRIYSMLYKGQTVPLNAYVTRANDKKIFFNDIKGERTYLKTMWKKGNWGRVLFNKMLALTINLGSEGSTLVLAPFPFLYGSICLGANTLVSPITAFFSKGKIDIFASITRPIAFSFNEFNLFFLLFLFISVF